MANDTKSTGKPIVTFSFDGAAVSGVQGSSVAGALLASGHKCFRKTPVSGASRGAYCLMGVCFDCLVSIDGLGNQQACLVAIRPGMRVLSQDGKREVGK
jgi:D-hydroxyproline dehydrogenase subunit gamma